MFLGQTTALVVMGGVKSASGKVYSLKVSCAWPGQEQSLKISHFFVYNPVYTTLGWIPYLPPTPPQVASFDSLRILGTAPQRTDVMILSFFRTLFCCPKANFQVIISLQPNECWLQGGSIIQPSQLLTLPAYGNTGSQSQPQLPALLTISSSSVYVRVCIQMLKFRWMCLLNRPRVHLFHRFDPYD